MDDVHRSTASTLKLRLVAVAVPYLGGCALQDDQAQKSLLGARALEVSPESRSSDLWSYGGPLPDLPSGTEFTAFLSLSKSVEIERGTAWESGRARRGWGRPRVPGNSAGSQGYKPARLQNTRIARLQGRMAATGRRWLQCQLGHGPRMPVGEIMRTASGFRN
ncbi:hypothetical protein C8Q70DRAFT_930390 [Cubamyces menziesii]|nr:hypothetical protein C8Q70DRAFT_930390 [Cubamyces menziesii]